jgi:hypothetical protein
MSDFSDAFADAFPAAVSVFGGTGACTIAGQAYDCIIHALDLQETIRGGTAGRQQETEAAIYLTAADWTDAKARILAAGRRNTKGAHVTVGGATLRILNDPDVGYDSDTVELRLGPLTT